ncbi:MAG: ABC transporter ATP-binding protein [Elusimicrobia bacterium CG11_big_fil_rev_8_21_14_0_20_64_6]|nr:MAG: ABC transporter ATP-binding protein [Elusimicrobia bacterium CG11_big_fil_rev_8_21_14_0_20_64_6]
MPGIGIKAVGLRKRLKLNQALDGVSLAFEPGLLHGLIGPDGAGKTTLLRALVGLLRPDEGLIIFSRNGDPVAFDEISPTVAYMPQRQSLYADLSISEHLDFFRDLYRLPDGVYSARRAELLQITRLEPFIDRPAGQLSGGMYKKLGLMCALLQSPTVLLLDEPTNGVDPISRREFWELLYRLAGGAVTIVVSTAYMDEAERCARVHLLDAGRTIAEGEPRRVLHESGAANFDELFMRREAAGR